MRRQTTTHFPLTRVLGRQTRREEERAGWVDVLRVRLNSTFDRLARLDVRLGHGIHLAAFHAWGYAGVVLSVLMTFSLAAHEGLSLWVMLAITLAAALAFLAQAMAVKIITGHERLVYYYQEIAVLVTITLLLWALHRPVLAYLDLAALGIGAFLAFGRLGCLMAGCCHGRPHPWGIRYGVAHAEAGFPRYFVGVRLFPIQAVESLWAFVTILAGSLLVVRDSPPGTALAWYVTAYGVGRFLFEFMRGDADRPYLWGFSEAQLISLVLMSAVAAAQLVGYLPSLIARGADSALTLTIIAILIAIKQLRASGPGRLLHARHMREVTEALDDASSPPDKTGGPDVPLAPQGTPYVRIGATSLGVQLSSGIVVAGPERVYHYAFSYRNGGMTESTARVLADLILSLRHPSASSTLTGGERGVFHLWVPETPPPVASPATSVARGHSRYES